MKKKSKIAGRVRALRTLLHKTQVEFANSLGVSQATVSSWELGEKSPSPPVYLLFEVLILANGQSLYSNAEWFSKQAANYLRSLGITGKIGLLKTGAQPVEEQTTRVPLYRQMAQGREETGRFLPVPTEFNLSPDSTIYLFVDETAASAMFEPGDLILLDTSESNTMDLRPFWEHVVLIDIRGDRGYSMNINPQGLTMGRLQCKLVRDRSALMPGNFSPPWWVATLGAFNAWDREWRGPIDEGLDVGRWIPFRNEKPGSVKEIEVLESEGWKRALSETRLDEPCHILGRVLGWFRPPGEVKGHLEGK